MVINTSSRGDQKPPGSLHIQFWKPILLLLVLGFAYLIFYRTFHIGIPCIFHLITGLQCPGCGMTRAIVAISKGDFAAAMQYNAMSLTVFPIMCIYFLYRYVRKARGNKKEFYLWEYFLLAILFILVLLYGYIRNQ